MENKEIIAKSQKKADKILKIQHRNLNYMNYYIESKCKVELFSDEYFILESLITKCYNRNIFLGQELKKEIKSTFDYLLK